MNEAVIIGESFIPLLIGLLPLLIGLLIVVAAIIIIARCYKKIIDKLNSIEKKLDEKR